MAAFVAILAATAVGTWAFTRHQRDVFHRTTSRFEQEASALAELQREVLRAEVPMGGVLYELEHRGGLQDQWQEFQNYRTRIDHQFGRLTELLPAQETAKLDEVRAAWTRVVAGVLEAKGMWGTGQVAAALARGEDPFARTVWASLTEAEGDLATLAVERVAGLRADADRAGQRQAALEPVLLASLLTALVLGALSGRRLSTRVVRPLLALGGDVVRMREGDLTGLVEADRSAGREIAELAESMSQMAVALDRSHGRLREQARTDTLTGLANRQALGELLDVAFYAAPADGGLALLLVDLDDFKFVNDSMGHAAGDAVLSAVAGRLRSAVREGDMVARLGGDEFAVVVQAHDAVKTAAVVAERILAALEDAVEVEGTPVRVGCSIGIAGGAPEAGAPGDVVRNADVAMYMAKSRGKNCFGVFDGTMYAGMLERAAIRRELAGAVERDELELHYQPVIDLHSDEILGFEALVRWRHADRGLLPPSEFIALAEETGDIIPIGGWVLERACRDLAAYQSASGGGRQLWMSVNVSGSQVLAGDLVTCVRSALARHGIDPGTLILEITEEAIMTDTAEARAVLADLRRDGVKVAIDDFGTGFSSLRYLHELPADFIKIDRSFVDDSRHDPERVVILETIVAMGTRLGLRLIAEGIERESECHRLRELGPMAGQGYLFARPMPALQAMRVLDAGVNGPGRSAAHRGGLAGARTG